jgi:hypothetical protein
MTFDLDSYRHIRLAPVTGALRAEVDIDAAGVLGDAVAEELRRAPGYRNRRGRWERTRRHCESARRR